MQSQTNPTNPELSHPTLLRLPAVKHRTGLGRSTIYRMMADDKFPKQVRIGDRAVGWREADIDSWCDARPVSH